MRPELVEYLQKELLTTDARLKRFTHDPKGRKYPQRFMFVKIQKLVDGFLAKQQSNRLVIIPGFRGVGKTTLMAQIASEYKTKIRRTLFLSVEDLRNFFDAGITDIASAYEEILGTNLETVKEPILIFLDEIQSDPNWALALKSLYEKTSNIFFCCTGSSAVVLQTTSDLARRAIFEKMPPMCFMEYVMLKNEVYPTTGLKDTIRQAIYFSTNAKEIYDTLNQIKSNVNQYWARVDRKEITSYLSFGSLPFTMRFSEETIAYERIQLLLDRIIQKDLPSLGSFDNETLGSIKRILLAISEDDRTSLNTLEKNIGISRLTIASVFDALEKAEVLIKVPAYGSNMTVAKKPNKYLFMSPALRMSFFHITGKRETFQTRQGKLLEDAVGSHLYREFIMRGKGAFRYDSAQGGADFILQIQNKKQIVIEVGMSEKTNKQVLETSKKIGSDYNIVYSSRDLRLDDDNQIVSVPLDFYFLM